MQIEDWARPNYVDKLIMKRCDFRSTKFRRFARSFIYVAPPSQSVSKAAPPSHTAEFFYEL